MSDISSSQTKAAQPPEAALLENPQIFLDNMFVCMDNLNTVLDKETTLLKKSKGLSEAEDLLTEKQKLSEICAKNMLVLSKAPSILDNVDWSYKTSLEERHKHFIESTKKNMEALTESKGSIERLTSRIMEATRDAVARNNRTYSSGGRETTRKQPVSISINETT